MENNNKKRNKVITILFVIFILISGSGIAYSNSETLMNQFFLLTKSPKEYYTYIEQYGMYRLITSLPKPIDPIDDNTAYDISSKITFNRGELDSVIKSATGASLTDFENTLGIPIDNVGLDIVHSSVDQKLYESIGIKLNDTKLITGEFLLDAATKKLSMRFPELSESYLTESYGQGETPKDTYQEQLKLLKTDILARISKRYMALFFDRLKHVTLEKNVHLSLDTMAVTCNQLTITITRTEAEDLFLTLFDTARADEEILSLLPLMHMTKDQYLQFINEIESAISVELKEHSDEDSLEMKLYVDGNGHILGRELTTFGYSTFGYTFLTEENYKEYEVHLTHGATRRKLYIHGQHRRVEDTYHGNSTFEVVNPTSAEPSDINAEVSYTDVRRESGNNQNFLSGTFTLSWSELPGIQLTSEFDIEGDKQLNSTVLRLGASPLVTIDSSREALSSPMAPLQEDSSTQYDISEYRDYLSNADIAGYLLSLSDTLGIDPDLFLDLFLNGMAQ